MATTAYKRSLKIGGTGLALDSISGTLLNAGDFAHVLEDGTSYIYQYKDYGAPQTENDPYIIVPDSGAGNFAWQLQSSPGFFEDSDLYISTTGNDTTGDGSSGNPWYSLEKVMDYLGDKWISSNITLTIHVGAGTYVGLSPVTITHPQANQVEIVGAGRDSSILTFSGEGITIDNTSLKLLSNLELKGLDPESTYTGLRVDAGSLKITDIDIDTWTSGITVTNNGKLAGSGSTIINNVVYGVTHLSGFSSISSLIVTGYDVDANSWGVYATSGFVKVTSADINACKVGIESLGDCYVSAETSDTTGCTVGYVPTPITSPYGTIYKP